MATNCLKAWAGVHLIHVGEWRISTGSQGFHDRLEGGFELVEKVSLPQWEGMHDMLTVWRRRDQTDAKGVLAARHDVGQRTGSREDRPEEPGEPG